MRNKVAILVQGNYALFTRPEQKVERVTYDVITPSAARGIVEAIYWHPQITWVIDRIHVLRPIKTMSIQRNEVKEKANANSNKVREYYIEDKHTPRSSLILQDVAYIIEAHFELNLEKIDYKEINNQKDIEEEMEKHFNIFKRRAKKGECYHRPYLGCREFDCYFEWMQPKDFPKSDIADTKEGNQDLGMMLFDINFENPKDLKARFFRARIDNGIIDLTRLQQKEQR